MAFLTTVTGWKKEDYLKKAALKSIAGLLNADGGHLIVGQADDATLVGPWGTPCRRIASTTGGPTRRCGLPQPREHG